MFWIFLKRILFKGEVFLLIPIINYWNNSFSVFLLEKKAFPLDIYFLKATWTSNVRVYSFQSNTKLYAKHMNAIFGDQFYRRYILKISQKLGLLWYLKFDFPQFVHDTFYAGNTHLGTSMVELIKPSRQAKWGTQNLFFHVFNRKNVSLNLKEEWTLVNAFSWKIHPLVKFTYVQLNMKQVSYTWIYSNNLWDS